MRHPRLKVWILDDGPSREIEAIAAWHGATYVTRADRSGAKAGNINNALRLARGDFVVIFDADHAPLPSFLERTMSCFVDPRIAFVQTPQSYRNRVVNRVAAGAHEQQALFYGPILRGKNAAGAVFSCGTNVIFRRSRPRSGGGHSRRLDHRGLASIARAAAPRMEVPVRSRGTRTRLGPGRRARATSASSDDGRAAVWRSCCVRRPFFLGMRPGAFIQYCAELPVLVHRVGLCRATSCLPICFLFLGLTASAGSQSVPDPLPALRLLSTYSR